LRRSPGVAIAAAVAIAALVGMAVAVVLAARGDDGDGGDARAPSPAFAATAPAAAPFGMFHEASVGLGERCLRVLVALDEAQRAQGLRDVESLAPYDGMLFVFPDDTESRFTMASTPLPLDITWFAADGAPVDHTRMAPCPAGDDASCPMYASDERYRYALERPGGAEGGGALGACA
jgi:uncharacterized membrane protein (UPF0127 family)